MIMMVAVIAIVVAVACVQASSSQLTATDTNSTSVFNASAHASPTIQVYVQVGEQRSASTRQAMAIQVGLSLKYPSIPVHHAYAWEANCDDRTYTSKRNAGLDENLNLTQALDDGELLVVKMHNIGNALKCIDRLTRGRMSTHAMWFVSRGRNSQGYGGGLDANSQVKIAHVQDYTKVINFGESELRAYQPVFELDDTHLAWFITYMRYWRILRVCCSFQASKHWRMILHGFVPEINVLKDAGYPDCEIYNLSQVEIQISRTVKQEVFGASLQHNTQIYSGAHCSTTNNAIRSGLDFNGRKLSQKDIADIGKGRLAL
eukprot:m.16314 g.16314  ORF g.16314 m.16314 type:complete len:317 (+) comp10982_c0_seq1:248-1198(+)